MKNVVVLISLTVTFVSVYLFTFIISMYQKKI